MRLKPTWDLEIYHTKFQKISSNGLNFASFLHFRPILAVFFGPKRLKSKINFCSIFFCWEASTYQISENFIKQFGFWKFSLFLINFRCFLAKKWPKKVEIKKIIFLQHFLSLGSIYIPNFRKFHRTVWILPIFLFFF